MLLGGLLRFRGAARAVQPRKEAPVNQHVAGAGASS
jgi:hypothetical protein